MLLQIISVYHKYNNDMHAFIHVFLFLVPFPISILSLTRSHIMSNRPGVSEINVTH